MRPRLLFKVVTRCRPASTRSPRMDSPLYMVTVASTRQGVATPVRLPLTPPNNHHMARWSWARPRHRCHLQTMRVYHNRIYTNKLPSEQDASGRLPWTSNRAESQQRSREWQAIWTQASRFDCNQARHTTLHLPMVWDSRILARAELRVGETAEHRGAVPEVATVISSGTWKNERSKRASAARIRGIEEIAYIGSRESSIRPYSAYIYHHAPITSLHSLAWLYLGNL